MIRNNTAKGNQMNSFDTQVHPEEMSFDQFTPEERAEFEAIQFEIDFEVWETVRGEEEFWDNLLQGA
jgi:hypothetical protein|tara:strand:+ start:439 stop:639 length:201 start_codon:yes stop_codon:yes gene_type:complete